MAKPARGHGNPALRLAGIRQLHTYLGVFIAPSVLFFALTGALQLFTLHEAHANYRPPALIEKLGMLHKDQVFAAKPARAAPPATKTRAGSKPADEHGETKSKASQRTLKWLFLAVAISLALSTCLGLWMGLLYSRRKIVAWGLLIAGAAIPVLILAL